MIGKSAHESRVPELAQRFGRLRAPFLARCRGSIATSKSTRLPEMLVIWTFLEDKLSSVFCSFRVLTF